MSKEKLTESVFGAFYDYPLSWTYAISLTAFQPMLKEFMPVFTQVFLLLCIHLMTILVDWLRKKLKIEKKDENLHQKSMEILKELEGKIEKRQEDKEPNKK